MTPAERRWEAAHARWSTLARAVGAARVDEGREPTIGELVALAEAYLEEWDAYLATLPPIPCRCGLGIPATGHDVDCPCCGRGYTAGGRELAPSWRWGEETGESWLDAAGGGR